jgi:hypothetical protein
VSDLFNIITYTTKLHKIVHTSSIEYLSKAFLLVNERDMQFINGSCTQSVDYKSNPRRIQQSIHEAKKEGASRRVDSDLKITGYGFWGHFSENPSEHSRGQGHERKRNSRSHAGKYDFFPPLLMISHGV